MVLGSRVYSASFSDFQRRWLFGRVFSGCCGGNIPFLGAGEICSLGVGGGFIFSAQSPIAMTCLNRCDPRVNLLQASVCVCVRACASTLEWVSVLLLLFFSSSWGKTQNQNLLFYLRRYCCLWWRRMRRWMIYSFCPAHGRCDYAQGTCCCCLECLALCQQIDVCTHLHDRSRPLSP